MVFESWLIYWLGEDLRKVCPADYVLPLLRDYPAAVRAYDPPASCRDALLKSAGLPVLRALHDGASAGECYAIVFRQASPCRFSLRPAGEYSVFHVGLVFESW